MLQKELAKRLKARYDTKMDGNEWLEVSSDGIPLCRIKYNGQYLSNADQNLSDEYRSKIADIQDEISTVREYVGLYEHAPQMKAADVSDYRRRFGVLGRLLAELWICLQHNFSYVVKAAGLRVCDFCKYTESPQKRAQKGASMKTACSLAVLTAQL